MGESVVEAPIAENKMGEPVASRPSLGVSISFGKYENDSLSWEKWSTFSPNKYLEEAGKFSTPGSVAQKKAYFEAHYKKIAEQKAEVVDQEKPIETQTSSSSDDRTYSDQSGPSSEETEQEVESKSDLECQRYVVEEDKEEFNGKLYSHVSNSLEKAVALKDENLVNGSQDTVEQNLESDITLECQSSLVSESSEVSNAQTNNHEFNPSVEALSVNNESAVMMKQSLQVDIQRRNLPKSEEKKLKPDARKLFEKVNPTKKERDLTKKKKSLASPSPKTSQIISTPKVAKPKSASAVNERDLTKKTKSLASPSPKTSQIISTPKVAKPKSASVVNSIPKSSVNKTNSSSLPRIKNPFGGERKRTGPTSLHLSLSLGSANPSSASASTSASLTTNRRSLFMEQMGDKDIVKRAFKAYQNNFNQLRSNDDNPHALKQVSNKGSEQKTLITVISQKENERARKTAEKISAQSYQSGRRLSSISTGSLNEGSFNERFVKAASSAVGLRSGTRAERPKEIFKKLEVKLNSNEADKRHLNLKSKEDREVEMRKLKQSLTFKAKPLPDFYRGMSKNSSEKDDLKNAVQRRPIPRR